MIYFSNIKISSILLVIFIALMFAIPNFFSKDQLNSFPSFIPKQQVNLGLDLQGGSHLLLEVDTVEIIKERLENLNSDVRRVLKKNNIQYSNFKNTDDNLKFVVEEFPTEIQKEISELSISNSQNILQMGDQTNLVILREENEVSISFTDEFVKLAVSNAVAQSLEIVRRRIDELGTREPSIQRQGSSRIIIQLPGIDDPDRIKALLGQTAKLTFQLVDTSTNYDPLNPKKAPPYKNTWMKPDGEMPKDERIHQALLLYASDMGLLGTANNPHGLNFMSPLLQSASLDHATWFHSELDFSDWLLYHIDSPVSGNARGFSRGSIYDKNGKLVASCVQEGLMRVWDKPKPKK